MTNEVDTSNLPEFMEEFRGRAYAEVSELDGKIKEDIEKVKAAKKFLVEMGELINEKLAGIGKLIWTIRDKDTPDSLYIYIVNQKIMVHIPGREFGRAAGDNLYSIDDIRVKEAKEILRILSKIRNNNIQMYVKI